MRTAVRSRKVATVFKRNSSDRDVPPEYGGGGVRQRGRSPRIAARVITPVQRLGVVPRSSHPAATAFPENVVGSACASTFSRLAQRSLALRPAHSRGHQYVTSYTEGFSHFVTSMTAPVASGWSGCRVGLAPTARRTAVAAA